MCVCVCVCVCDDCLLDFERDHLLCLMSSPRLLLPP